MIKGKLGIVKFTVTTGYFKNYLKILKKIKKIVYLLENNYILSLTDTV